MLLTALACFRYNGTRYLPGDTCDIVSADARSLVSSGLASETIEDAEVVSMTKHSDQLVASPVTEVPVIQNALDLLDGMTPVIADKCSRSGIVGIEQIREMSAVDLSMKLKIGKSIAQRLITSAINDFSDGE